MKVQKTLNAATVVKKITELNRQPKCIIVSACLLGINCRYDGDSRLHRELTALRERYSLIPVCPEQLGGLPTPRPPAEIQNGTGTDVINQRARILTNVERLDVTGAFLRGADETLKIAQFFNATVAILQQRSPSCGFGTIYRNHQLSTGNGVAAARLANGGLTIFSID